MSADRMRGLRAQWESQRAARIMSQPCSCGCGTVIHRNENGYLAPSVRGHLMRGKTRPTEWKEKQAAGVKRAWDEGKYEGKPRPDYGVIAAKNRGQKRSTEHNDAQREKIKRQIAAGAFSTPEAKKNARISMRKSIDRRKAEGKRLGRTAEQMREIADKRDMEALASLHRERMLGHHGFGTGEQGRSDHFAAGTWAVCSPTGVIYRFTNLRGWCWKNQQLFVNEDATYANARDWRHTKNPLWLRAFNGLRELASKRGRSCSWRGWTLVGHGEITQGTDLLGRDEATFEIQPRGEEVA